MKAQAASAAKGATVLQHPAKGVSQRPRVPQKTAAEVLGQDDGRAPDYEKVGLDETFADLVRSRQKKAAKKTQLEGEIKDLSETIGQFLKDAEVEAVTVDGEWGPKWSAGRVTETLSVQKLLEEGVSAALIAKCTIRSQGAPFIRVDRLGQRGR